MLSLFLNDASSYIFWFADLIPIEEEIDNWVNQDFWYHNQCIVHYDTDMPLQNGTDNEPRPITRSSPVDSFSSSQNLHQSNVDSNVFMTNGQTPPHHSSSSSLRVQIESPASSIYMAQNEPSVFVPSPTIPLQNRTSSSGGSKYSSMFSSVNIYCVFSRSIFSCYSLCQNYFA